METVSVKTPPKEILMAISRSTVTQLSLARNQFEIITNDTFPFMAGLQLLDLREVLMTDILSDALKDMPALRTLLVSGNKLNYVPDGVLLENLTYLDISSNSKDPSMFTYFSLGKNSYTFSGLMQLRVLGLKNSSINCIEDGTFLQLPNLLVLNLENNYFKLNNNVFNGLENLQVLLLGGSSISYIPINNNPFQNLTRLAHLGLENNALLTLSSEELRPLSNLITIDVSRNRLTSWDKRVFIYNSKISVMLISNNKLSHFSKSMLDDFTNLSRFDISGNPFVCDCKSFRTLYEWFEINGNATILNLFNGNPTYCVYPENVADENLMNVYELFQSGSRRCESIDMNEYFLTAVGSVICESVMTSIEKSRKTILIISDAYARSEWCRWEVQIVQHHRLFIDCGDREINDSLIMIKLGNVSKSNCTPTLKYLMKTRIYLEWDRDAKKQKVFWEKLRKVLTRKKSIYDSCV
ncbi:hypothetical protein FQA39_LY11088 [Lamprigera yunnana]|nr:hypothetical protein FQA39_LY11088 [Lamprigera yunnana]